jgi:hypothetical protein
MMPYSLVEETDEIDWQLTVSQFSDKDDYLPDKVKVIEQLN